MKTPFAQNYLGSSLKAAHQLQSASVQNHKRQLDKNAHRYKSMFELDSDVRGGRDQSRGDANQKKYSNRATTATADNKEAKRTKAARAGDSGSSGNNGSIAGWKLKKAIRAFKMVRLDEVELEFASPHVQYFLAKLCDHDTMQNTVHVALSTYHWGIRARCSFVEEVRTVVKKLKASEPVNPQKYQLSVAVTVLKEFLSDIPGGVFNDMANEFFAISLHSTLDITIMYLHSILHELPYVVQQFTFLLCNALRNMVRLTGGHSVLNYTDLLMHFTPVLFPTAVGDVDRFLRSSRLLLVMVDHCERVFLPLPLLDGHGNWCWHTEDYEHESFVRKTLDSLQNLEASLACDDSGVESEVDETSYSTDQLPVAGDPTAPHTRSNLSHSFSLPDLYRFTYLEESDDNQSSTFDV